ncbi:cellulose biosynthesis protein BcsP [Burkholderia plantarii]|nr:cellulose biosynthesis protein BcsP [Burkholderia plantarii]
MNTSRDVKALFDRFGGDASSYQEIRMENEALDARRRWPLLGMIDPRQTEVAAAAGSPAPAAEADAGNPARPGPAGTRGQDASRNRTHAVLRSTAPLFTRSPRRDVPPVIVKEAAPAAPEGSTYRFSPPPGSPAGDVTSPADEPLAAPAAAATGTDLAPATAGPILAAIAQPAIAPRFAQPARVTDVPDLSAADAAALAAPREPAVLETVPVQAVVPEAAPPITPASTAHTSSAFARLVSPGRARAASTGIFPAPLGNAQRLPARQPLGAAPMAAPAAPAAKARPAQSSVPSLKKLAGAPAAPARPSEAAGAAHGEERLDSLFSRLRRGGAAPSSQITVTQPAAAPKAAARRPWFLRGASQS